MHRAVLLFNCRLCCFRRPQGKQMQTSAEGFHRAIGCCRFCMVKYVVFRCRKQLLSPGANYSHAFALRIRPTECMHLYVLLRIRRTGCMHFCGLLRIRPIECHRMSWDFTQNVIELHRMSIERSIELCGEFNRIPCDSI